MTTARQAAADVLHRSRDRHGFAAELIDDAITALANPADRRFLTQFVFGVMRRKGTLDALLRPFIRTPLHAVQPRVWDVLHLGAFQLAFLTHVPKHAAVHETVELAAHVGSPQAKGFLNGVLRRVAELVTDEFTDRAGPAAIPFDYTPSPLEGEGSERSERVRGSPRLRFSPTWHETGARCAGGRCRHVNAPPGTGSRPAAAASVPPIAVRCGTPARPRCSPAWPPSAAVSASPARRSCPPARSR